jgi:ribonuclease-3
MSDRLLRLAERLDEDVLTQVFTHSSLVAERGRSYERLEFLGDSVLSLCVTTELYRRFPGYSEGHLARLRAYVVSRVTCAKVATRLGLGEMLREHSGRGRDEGEVAQLMSNQNVLADLTEALIGALYVTFGFEAVRPAVVEVFTEHIDYAQSSYVDHKTELQEGLAKSGRNVGYRVVGQTGPPHDREFEIEAVIDGEVLGRGVGRSKKLAEQEAAEEALRELQARDRRKNRRARLRTRRKPDEGESDAASPLDRLPDDAFAADAGRDDEPLAVDEEPLAPDGGVGGVDDDPFADDAVFAQARPPEAQAGGDAPVKTAAPRRRRRRRPKDG